MRLEHFLPKMLRILLVGFLLFMVTFATSPEGLRLIAVIFFLVYWLFLCVQWLGDQKLFRSVKRAVTKPLHTATASRSFGAKYANEGENPSAGADPLFYSGTGLVPRSQSGRAAMLLGSAELTRR
jgi:hypothetical protein